MSDVDQDTRQLRRSVSQNGILLTRHAYEEALADGVSVREIREAIINGMILEDYSEHQRGPCFLMYGKTEGGRDLHIVLTKGMAPILVITVYEPKPPHWVTPTERGR